MSRSQHGVPGCPTHLRRSGHVPPGSGSADCEGSDGVALVVRGLGKPEEERGQETGGRGLVPGRAEAQVCRAAPPAAPGAGGGPGGRDGGGRTRRGRSWGERWEAQPGRSRALLSGCGSATGKPAEPETPGCSVR